MIKQVASIAAAVAALFASAAMPAAAEEPTAQPAAGTYNWLHPKLGIVKVDRATGAIVHSQGSVTQSAPADSRSRQTKYWLDPKGNYRVLKAPLTDMPQGAAAEARN